MARKIDLDYVLKHFEYDEITGDIKRIVKVKGSRGVGRKVGRIHSVKYLSGGVEVSKKYKRITVNGSNVYAHRVAWVLMTKEQPPSEIDHIDGDGTNNSWSNLRGSDRAINMKNQKKHSDSKFPTMGISLRKDSGKYRARIMVDGKSISLGSFDNYKDAEKARIDALAKYGFHENHGAN